MIRRVSESIDRAPTRGERVASDLAQAVGGQVLRLPCEGRDAACLVQLVGGEVPVLVRDFFNGSVGLSVSGGQSWGWTQAQDLTTHRSEILAAIEAWAQAHPGQVTMWMCADRLVQALSSTYQVPFEARIPGTPNPNELWLHGPDPAEASVGVFTDRVVVWVEDEMHEVRAAGVSELQALETEVIRLVNQQLGLHTTNLELSAQVDVHCPALTQSLCEQLSSKEAPAFTWRRFGASGHDGVADGVISWTDSRRRSQEVARLSVRDGVLWVRAGLFGAQGVDAVLRWPDDRDEIVSAVQTWMQALTPQRLKAGCHYRVLAAFSDFSPGDIVTYLGFDDIDNHCGCYEFQLQEGPTSRVCGDCSNPASNPLRRVHELLMALP